jgi:NADPH:quinone reductase-like Zn-dependent oxidoreductase
MAALTAWQGLFERGELMAGQRVLVLGASGGVGHVAVQLARWRGALVAAAASSAGLERARAAGAHELISDVDDLREPVDLVFDTAGGERLVRAASRVRPSGKVIGVAEESGVSEYFVVEPNGEQLRRIDELVEHGVLEPEVDRVYPLEEARAAFERLEQRGRRGKVVLTTQPG